MSRHPPGSTWASSTRHSTRSRFRAGSATSSCLAICRPTARWVSGDWGLARPRHLDWPLLHVGVRLPPRQCRACGVACRGRGEGGPGQADDRRRIRRHLLGSRRHRDPVPARARHAGDGGRALAAGRTPQGAGGAVGCGPRAAARGRHGEGCPVLPAPLRHGKGSRPEHPSVSGFRSATRGWACSRRRPARSHTSRISESRWRPSIAARSSRVWSSWARRSRHRRTNPVPCASPTSTAFSWS